MRPYHIVIPGKPIPQKRWRVGKYGAYDPSAGDKKKVRPVIAAQWKNKEPITGPLCVWFAFLYQRPKSHYRSVNRKPVLKPTSPMRYTKPPDIDNLTKFYLDVMNKLVFDDDRQVYMISARKIWTDGIIEEPQTDIWVMET